MADRFRFGLSTFGSLTQFKAGDTLQMHLQSFLRNS